MLKKSLTNKKEVREMKNFIQEAASDKKPASLLSEEEKRSLQRQWHIAALALGSMGNENL